MDEEFRQPDEDPTLLHGRGVSGRFVVIACLFAAALIGLGMTYAMLTGEVDESYEPPVGTPTPTPIDSLIPWLD